MAIYNVILFSKIPADSEVKKEREERNELINKFGVSKASRRHGPSGKDEHSRGVYFFFDEESMSALFDIVKENDVIRIHGHGNPMILGTEYSRDNLTAYSLAKKISDYKIPRDRPLIIDILSCHSAVSYTRQQVCSYPQTPPVTITYNFAQDVSMALGLLGYNNLTVWGYTGYIVDKKKDDKYSVQSFGSYDQDTAVEQGETLKGKHKLPPYDQRETIQGDFEKCRHAYFLGRLHHLPEGYTKLHLSKYRELYWQSSISGHRLSDGERENFHLIREAEVIRCLWSTKAMEDWLVPDHKGKDKFLFFKSSKSAQEAFDESPEFKPTT